MKNLNLIPAAKDEDYTYLIIAQYLSHLTLFLKTGTSYEGRWEIFSRSFPLHLQQFSPFNLVGQGFMRLLVAINSSLRLEIKSHLYNGEWDPLSTPGWESADHKAVAGVMVWIGSVHRQAPLLSAWLQAAVLSREALEGKK